MTETPNFQDEEKIVKELQLISHRFAKLILHEAVSCIIQRTQRASKHETLEKTTETDHLHPPKLYHSVMVSLAKGCPRVHQSICPPVHVCKCASARVYPSLSLSVDVGEYFRTWSQPLNFLHHMLSLSARRLYKDKLAHQ